MFKRIAVVFFAVAGILAKRCVETVVPVPITARQGIFGGQVPLKDDFDAAEFIQNLTVTGRNYTDTVLTEYATLDATFNVTGQFCIPDVSVNSKTTLQILTHGLGYDRQYWDWPFQPDNYSYVNTATDGWGYSTFAYDRLSIPHNDSEFHPDPINVVQANVQLAILNSLTTMLRANSVPGVDTSTYTRFVHVGHSYGSILSYELAAQFPHNSDAIILTGYAQTSVFTSSAITAMNSVVAADNRPERFAGLDSGYLLWGDLIAFQWQFLRPPFFNRNGAELLSDEIKQPFTVGEWLTLGNAPLPALQFTRPVMVLTGQQDAGFCGGNCFATGTTNLTSFPASVQANVPNASAFEVLIHPNSGHAINLHFNATGAYNAINNFLESHGL